ncbi:MULTISPECIES: hypothetical protein [Calothrix]|uniref:Uncharacterized protein n=2 Tax=Calothrix TaxID=1186 RepID=A0ABR8ACR3_9CYAN|nr:MULTISPECIES: hypothetical protein [Calothrix]MBD2197688.1 hypothetical protein [Calothrix parietina FACHB-288]MBD2225617.1 hypothetical protein [Calothrix anomala FACHB-343]
MNSIMVIRPYKYDDIWVFDDDKVGLVREPFVAGADKIIDRLVAHIPINWGREGRQGRQGI